MTTAAKSRPRTRTAPANRNTPRRVRRPVPVSEGPDMGTIATWAGFALAGLVIAIGVAAILVDEVPFEDRHMRNARLRFRDRAASASGEAIEALTHQFADLRRDLTKRLSDLR
jgi:hypothetical protein